MADRSAIVTGAGSGIGRGVAEVFAKEEANVLVVDINESAARDVAAGIEGKGGRASFLGADVTRKSDMENMASVAMDRFGRLDILCQNTGIYPKAVLEDLTEEIWDKVLAVNLKGAYLAIKACIPYMKRQKFGRVVVTSSITGPITVAAGYSHYAASKAGVVGLVKTIALEVAQSNITVNAVQPGTIRTPGLKNAMSAAGLGEEHFAAQAKAIPMGYLGEPEDVAYAMLFLASDEARYITGHSIVVDGGQILPESGYSM